MATCGLRFEEPLLADPSLPQHVGDSMALG